MGFVKFKKISSFKYRNLPPCQEHLFTCFTLIYKTTYNFTKKNDSTHFIVIFYKSLIISSRCGAIYVGDQILSIDDVSFEHVTLAEANQILKNCVGEFSRVEILPLSQMVSNKTPSTKSKFLFFYVC